MRKEFVIFWIVLLGACCPVQQNLNHNTDLVQSTETWTQTDLYFGFSIDDGETVSEKDWTAFLAEIVTPRFPDGLTVLKGYGQWRDSENAIKSEESRVLIILHPGKNDTSVLIDEIRKIYIKKFHQESVLRADHPVRVDF